jgi:hypothetical protein
MVHALLVLAGFHNVMKGEEERSLAVGDSNVPHIPHTTPDLAGVGLFYPYPYIHVVQSFPFLFCSFITHVFLELVLRIAPPPRF